MKDQAGNSSGFTIVELITAMVVGVIMISGAVLVLTSGQTLAQRHRDLVAANSFAEQKIEALRSIGYLGVSNGTTDVTSQLPNELKSPRSGSLVTSSFSTGVKKAQLTITYNDQGIPRTYVYTTLIGELGVGQY